MSRSKMSIASKLWKLKYPLFKCTKEEVCILRSMLKQDLSYGLCAVLVLTGHLEHSLMGKIRNKVEFSLMQYMTMQLPKIMVKEHRSYLRYIWIVKLISYNSR